MLGQPGKKKIVTYTKKSSNISTSNVFSKAYDISGIIDEPIVPAVPPAITSVPDGIKRAVVNKRLLVDDFEKRLSNRLSLMKLSTDQMPDGELARLLGNLHLDHPRTFEDWLYGMEQTYSGYWKQAESSFCEVYNFESEATGTNAIVKIIPLLTEGAKLDVVPEPMEMEKALHEVNIQKAVSSLAGKRKYSIPSGHTGFKCARRMTVVQGACPARLLEKWDSWRPGSSLNFRPDFYRDTDLFLVLEMEFGGVELESFKVTTTEQIRSIVVQLILALEMAETEVEFEHRDLHLGNILVQHTPRPNIRIDSRTNVKTEGILVNIIDFSLSRAKNKSGQVLFSDLDQDEWLFKGDAAVSSQYDVYREMKAQCGLGWSYYQPATNVLWLRYVLGHLMGGLTESKKKGPCFEALEHLVGKLEGCASCGDACKILPNLQLI